MSASIKKKGDALAFIGERLDQLRRTDVLVGIPADATQRKGDPINNASLLFIHTHGSPLRNIPPRPVLEPSIEQNKSIITPHLGAAATAVLQKDPVRAQRELELAGTIAANGAKRYVLQGNNLKPNAPSTIKRKGSNRPLVDTTRMIGAITSIVRTNK